MTETTKERVSRAVGQSSKSIVKPILQGAVVLAVFMLGLAIGNGTIVIGKDAPKTHSANTQLPDNLNYASVESLYDELRQRYDGKLDQAQLLDGLKKGLISATNDPYTAYFNTKEAEDFESQLSGSFTGIGAQLSQNDKKEIEVVSPIDGTPAQKAGLKPKDIIASVDGKSTTGWSVDEAVSKIRGKKDTKVKLFIVRGSETLELTITRAEITIPSVTHEVKDGDIGYIRITQFSEDTGELTRQAAQDLADKKVKGIVLDLRSNPGGLVSSAIDVASLWLPKDAVVMQEKRDGAVIRTYRASGDAVLSGVKTTVLIDEGSASASEIVAGALKDNKVASLIGTKSYGKGSVQEIQPFSGGGELKVTVARWYRPNGQNIDKKGIDPDKKVSLGADDIKADRDPQLEAALAAVR